MTSAQSVLVSKVQVQDSRVHGVSPTDDIRLPYTQQPTSNPNLPKYPPQHSGTHGTHLNHDPEQARFRIPPNFSESSINLSKLKTDQAHPADSKVRDCFIDDDDDIDRDG